MEEKNKTINNQNDEINSFDKSYEILSLIKKLREVSHKRMKKYFCDMKLTGPQGMLVSILSHDGDMKVSDLSKKMCLSNSTVSGIIDRLEKQGYVERKRSESDRRVVMISVTGDLREKIDSRMELMESSLKKLMDQGSESELGKVLEGFKILSKLIERAESSENEER